LPSFVSGLLRQIPPIGRPPEWFVSGNAHSMVRNDRENPKNPR
jgi:hypothetical protein